MDNIQHPDITLMERNGVPEQETYICPICHAELLPGDTVYKDFVEVIGCKECVEIGEAADALGEDNG